jgi:hypothetical protein
VRRCDAARLETLLGAKDREMRRYENYASKKFPTHSYLVALISPVLVGNVSSISLKESDS